MPLDGLPEFLNASKIILFGNECTAVTERVATTQCLSGTGSLRIAGEFLHRYMPHSKIYIPSTTWENHWKLFEACGMETHPYRYLDDTGYNFGFDDLMQDLAVCPPHSIILLHMVGHNPSGVDPSEEQWEQIIQLMLERNLFPLLDNAYQGFISGDHEKDAHVARRLVAINPPVEFVVACSFAKNFGLYGERIGALHLIAKDKLSAQNCLSQLKVVTRIAYSNCPAHGARIVAEIVHNEDLYLLWRQECKRMADRLNGVRVMLVEGLIRVNAKGNWDHILRQKGMFSFTGISAENVVRLKNEHHIYMLENGRLSLAGLNTGNVDRFVACVRDVLGTN